jgi:hypothetical protein
VLRGPRWLYRGAVAQAGALELVRA